MNDDDPYQVYTLRHPSDRASSLVPQLQKQPEMADTRLRYRRIAPNARSGSIGSLGGHFPPLFKFPPRPSLLESLTSDDEPASSSSLSRRRKPPLAALAASNEAMFDDESRQTDDAVGAKWTPDATTKIPQGMTKTAVIPPNKLQSTSSTTSSMSDKRKKKSKERPRSGFTNVIGKAFRRPKCLTAGTISDDEDDEQDESRRQSPSSPSTTSSTSSSDASHPPGVSHVVTAKDYDDDVDEDHDGDEFERDKELSVSFVHRTLVQEADDSGPFAALKKLWNYLATAHASARASRQQLNDVTTTTNSNGVQPPAKIQKHATPSSSTSTSPGTSQHKGNHPIVLETSQSSTVQ